MCDAEWGGLQPQQWYHYVVLAPPDPNFPKFAPPLYRDNCVRVHPNTFPQHMKVLKHFICMYYGCVMQSGVVYSLNKVNTMSFLLHLTPISQSLPPPPCNKIEAITNQVESSTSQGRSLEGILSKVKHVCTVKHTSFTMKIARDCATSDSKVTRNGSVPSRKTQNTPQRTHLMDFFQKNLGVTWGHIYQHHSCIKKSFKQKK